MAPPAKGGGMPPPPGKGGGMAPVAKGGGMAPPVKGGPPMDQQVLPEPDHRSMNHHITVMLPIPIQNVSSVIGKGGVMIEQVRRKTMAHIDVQKREEAFDGTQTVTIRGPCGVCQDAISMIV